MPTLTKSHSHLLGSVCCALFFSCPAFADPAVNTVPQGGQVIHGDATISYPNVRNVQVNQTSDRAVINWQHFNIGKNGKATFVQPDSNALVVNRVTGAGQNPTEIFGTIEANGRVMVLDRNGVIFAQDAVINVGGIIAAAGDIDVDSFRNEGKIHISGGKNTAEVINNGIITAKDGGLAALVAPNVSNTGTIPARMGQIEIAGAQTATIDLYGDGMIQLAVQDSAKVGVSNTGTLSAENGYVRINTADAASVLDNVISHDGTITAGNIEVNGRDVKLTRRSTTTATQNITVNASNDITVQTTGITNLNGDIALNAGNDISLNTGSAIGASLNMIANQGSLSLQAGNAINVRTGSGRNAHMNIGGYNVYLATNTGDINFSAASANATVVGAAGGELSILPGRFLVSSGQVSFANVTGGKVTMGQDLGGSFDHILSSFSNNTDNTLVLGAGTYVLPSFNLQNIRIKGAKGAEHTIISGHNSFNAYGGTLAFDGLTFTSALDISGFENVTISNSYFNGAELAYGLAPLTLTNVAQASITDSVFTGNFTHGVVSTDTHWLNIENSSFKNIAVNAVQIVWSRFDSAYRGGLTIKNSLFDANDIGVQATGKGSLTIEGTQFTNNQHGIVADLASGGYAGNVLIADTSFIDNRIGAFLTDTELDVRDASPVFSGGEHGLVLDGRLSSLAGNTLGSIRFSGQQLKAINLQNHALVLSDPVDGRSVDWGFSDYKNIESRLTHQTSSATLGKIDFGLLPPKSEFVVDDVLGIGRQLSVVPTEIFNISVPFFTQERGKVTVSGMNAMSLSFPTDAASLAMIETAAGGDNSENCSEMSFEPTNSDSIFTAFSAACGS